MICAQICWICTLCVNYNLFFERRLILMPCSRTKWFQYIKPIQKLKHTKVICRINKWKQFLISFCLIKGKPLKPKIKGNIRVPVNTYITLTCSSRLTAAPDYYSKLVTLYYTWFINKTWMDGETRENLEFYVTENVKYNRYSCKTIEENLESERSDPIQINPLCKQNQCY